MMMRGWNLLRKTCCLISLAAVAGLQRVPGPGQAGEVGAKNALALKEKHCFKHVLKNVPLSPSFAMSSDGKLMALAGTEGKAVVWDLTTGKEKVAFATGGWVTRIAFDPAGRRLAAGTSASGLATDTWSVKFWDSESGQESVSFITGSTVSEVVFHPSKKQVVILGEKSVLEFRDAETLAVRRSLRPHRLGVTQVLFSPDGKKIATSSTDGTVKITEDASGEELLTLKCQHSVRGIAFHPSGKFIASAGLGGTKVAGGVKIWNAENGELVRTHDAAGGAMRVAYSPDAKLLAVGGAGSGRLSIQDAETGRELVAVDEQDWPCSGLAFNPEGTLLIAAFGGTVKVWEVSPPAWPGKKETPKKAP
jgi:WD40 repeat protein